jgi:N4-gp56 family major capsid protein
MPTTVLGAANLNTSTTFADSVRAHLAKQTLAIAKKKMAFWQIGDALTDLSGGMGKVWKGVRYERIPKPLAPLTEGTTPDGSSMSITPVTGTAEQWGRYITLTDVGLLTVTHPIMVKANELLGKNAAETIDTETQRTLQYGTQVYFPSTVTARSGLTAKATHKLTHETVMKAVSWLNDKGADTYDGGTYLGVVDPLVANDFKQDTTFVAAAQYSAVNKLFNNEIGTWAGVRWIESNHVQRFTTAAAPTATGETTSGAALTALRTYWIVLVFRNPSNQNEVIYQRKNVALGTAHNSITLTIPAAPVTGGVFDVYVGIGEDDTGAAYQGAKLQASNKEAGSYVITTDGTGAEAPVPPAELSAASRQTVHCVYIFGKGGWGKVDLTGLTRHITPAAASDSDPLEQRRKTGWKAFYKAIILNNDFFCRIECLSTLTASA